MKILRFDSVGGASGDMTLAALVALGAPVDKIAERLSSLPIERFALRAEPATDRGFAGVRMHVDVADEHHPHRHLADIEKLLAAGRLPDRARSLAVAVFQRLAAAEAAVHGTTPERIHFHEVGAMDSILDIAGACVALDLLGIDAVEVSPLPVGRGSVRCAHGVMPLPVPAVAELLKGRAVIETDEPFELVTPTGAALLTTWAETMPAPAQGSRTVLGTGYGVGHRALDNRPNVLRAMLLEGVDGARAEPGACIVLECQVDDTTPELIGATMEQLMAAGALDAFTTPVFMKKQRPGSLITVLADPADREKMLDVLFTGVSTLGVRETMTQRTTLARRHVAVETPFGAVRVKVGTWRGRDVTRAPEYEDCAAAAARAGVAVRAVYDAALAADRPPA